MVALVTVFRRLGVNLESLYEHGDAGFANTRSCYIDMLVDLGSVVGLRSETQSFFPLVQVTLTPGLVITLLLPWG